MSCCSEAPFSLELNNYDSSNEFVRLNFYLSSSPHPFIVFDGPEEDEGEIENGQDDSRLHFANVNVKFLKANEGKGK